MHRAIQTAEIINKDKNVQMITDERIRERKLGELEGHEITNEMEKKIWNYDLNYQIPKGENLHDFEKRILDFLNDIKKKYEGTVYKRRERMILSEAVPYLAGKSEPGFDSQILHEITWFRNYYRGLAPAMYIAYDRIACFGTEDRNFRVTFDTNIRWRTDNLCLDGPTEGTRLLEPGWYLMEMKTPGAVPLWFSKILDDLAIYPASFSKYGVAYQIENQKASEEKEEEKAFIPFTDIRQTVSKTAFR